MLLLRLATSTTSSTSGRAGLDGPHQHKCCSHATAAACVPTSIAAAEAKQLFYQHLKHDSHPLGLAAATGCSSLPICHPRSVAAARGNIAVAGLAVVAAAVAPRATTAATRDVE